MHLFDSDSKFMGGWGIVGVTSPSPTALVGQSSTEKKNVSAFVSSVMVPCIKVPSLKRFAWLNCINCYVSSFVKTIFYAMGTSLDRQSAITDLHKRVDGVGMKSEQFEGFDVEVVRQKVAEAREFAVSGKGPVLLEIITYRHRGHSMSDPAKYRPDGELDEKKKSDPLLIAEERLTKDFGMTTEELKAVQKRSIRLLRSHIPLQSNLLNQTQKPFTTLFTPIDPIENPHGCFRNP